VWGWSWARAQLKEWKNHAWNMVTKFIKIYLSDTQICTLSRITSLLKMWVLHETSGSGPLEPRLLNMHVWPTIARWTRTLRIWPQFLYEMPTTTTFFFFLPLVDITENLVALPTKARILHLDFHYKVYSSLRDFGP
jgi:hypothetical protein